MHIPLLLSTSCYSEWHPDAFRCHQSTVRKVICCSLFHTQIELPVPVRPAAQRCVKDCSVGPGRGLCYFLFFPSIAFLLFTYDISNHHLVNTSSLLFFLFYLLSYFVLPPPFVTLFMLLSFHLTRLGFIDTSSQAERSLSFMRWSSSSPSMRCDLVLFLFLSFLHEWLLGDYFKTLKMI